METRHGLSQKRRVRRRRRRNNYGEEENPISTSKKKKKNYKKTPRPPSFSDLPADVILRVSAAFSVSDLRAASAACRSWRDALRPLREAAVLFRWGKRYRHGGHGVSRSPEKALESFVSAARLGHVPAAVDAGLMYWEMGMREEGMRMCRRAAEAGHPAGMCNLGTCYLEGDPPDPQEAVKWFYQAAESGYARAQFNLALCLQRGRGIKCSLPDAAKWYEKAAKGGYVRAMYNASLCYSTGEGGLRQDLQKARMWMKCAAEGGHTKAQSQHGLDLFYAGDTEQAIVYLELAARAGETASAHIRGAILRTMSQMLRDRTMLFADKWRPRKFDG